MFNSGLTGVLGLVYWVVVARLYPAGSVGLAAALISSATLLSFIGSLGLGYGLVRFLPDAGVRSSVLINSVFTLSAGTSVVIALVFLAGLDLWSPALLPVREHPIFLLSFVAFVPAATLAGLLDQTFVGLRRAGFTLAKGGIFNLGRVLAAAMLSAAFGVFGIFVSWGLALGAALAAGLFLLLPRAWSGYRPKPSLSRQVINELMHFSFVNYVSQGLWATPVWILPIIVVNLLGAQANAYFYMSWVVSSFLFAVPLAISMSLFAEGSHHEDRLATHLGGSLKLMILLLVPAMAVLFLVADKVLLIFGDEYSKAGGRLPLVLVASTFPMGLNLLYLGAARVERRFKDIILVASSVAIGTLGLSYILLPWLGILGTGLAWLASHMGVALALAPRWRALLKGRTCQATKVPEIANLTG
jgi:O-antigen/teichoic acid export membrane protein